MTPVPVLLFHGVGDAPDIWTVSAQRFTAAARAVADCGRTPLTVGDYVARLRAGGPIADLVVVSFDDGESSNLTSAQELAALGVPCTVYVTCEHLGQPGMLDEAGLRELAAVPGVEIGSHSMAHVHLDELPVEEIRRQTRGSRARLEDVIGRPVLGIAYPHGDHDARVLRETIAAGFTSGAGVKNALSHERDNPMAVARVTMTTGTSPDDLHALLAGQGRLGEVHPRLRTRGYRVVRRARRALRRAEGP